MAAMQSLPPRRKTPASSVLSWQAETNLGAGQLVRLLADYRPTRMPLHLMFWPSRLASSKMCAFADWLVERLRCSQLLCRAASCNQ
jgi:DNA-binding transcriptional LysR family regulator